MKGDLTKFMDVEKLCPSYRKKLKEIEAEFKADRNANAQQKLLDQFSKNFLMPTELWGKLIELYICNIRNGLMSVIQLENLRQRAIDQFYHDKKDRIHDEYESFLFHPSELRKLLTTDPKLDKYKSMGVAFIKMKEQQLKYPHQNLEEVYKFYERYSYRTPSTSLKNKYRSMKQLYSKIKAAEDDVEQWFQKLLETDDHQFVVHNMEYRLGGDLNNKKLWKLYIEYLRDTNPNNMLQIYSKYCRYFIDDYEMMETYKIDVVKYGPVFVKWDNPFSFEHREIPNVKKIVKHSNKGISHPASVTWLPELSAPAHIDKTYNFQSFSIPNTLIYYILQRSNYSTLQKLHMSCKYFFVKKATPVCYNFEYYCSREFNEHQISYADQSIKLNTHVKKLDEIKKFYVANSLKLYCKNQGIQGLLQRLYRCEAKHLKIKKQSLTGKEFEYLVGHGNVETLILKKVKIHTVNGDIMALEDVMAKIPKITELRLDNVRVTSDTAQILCKLPFENKVISFKAFHINNLLNLDEFFVFINNIIHSQARLDFSCSEDAGDDFVWEFKRHQNLFDKLWKKSKTKPVMAVFSSFEHEMLSHI